MTTPTAARWDVFLSYASPDRPIARSLYDALIGLGLRVFFDQEALAPGDDWHLLLPRHVRGSSVAVVLVSEHTEGAHYQHSELIDFVTLVREQRRRLVPVRLADVGLPFGLGQLHALDMFDDTAVPDVARRIATVVPGQAAGDRVFSSRVPVVSGWFTGRDELLARLSASLQAGGTTVLTQAIAGLGGVGKTTVAAALAEQQREAFDVVWWVRAEELTTLVADLAALAPHVSVSPQDDPADTARLVRETLETTDRRWLVVFDNIADHRSWLPRRGRGAVVITSRSPTFPGLAVERIDTLPLYEATLADRERILGPDHSDTLQSRINLAGAYQAAGDLGRAIPLYEATITDQVRIIGPDHPETLLSRNNLATAYSDAGDLDRAIRMLEATLADCQRVLGEAHPTTRRVRRNLERARQQR